MLEDICLIAAGQKLLVALTEAEPRLLPALVPLLFRSHFIPAPALLCVNKARELLTTDGSSCSDRGERAGRGEGSADACHSGP